MSFSTSLIKAGNKIFKPVKHPFNMQNDGEKSYAEWQFEKAPETLKCYHEPYNALKMFRDKRILDIGCGAGGKSLYYATLDAVRVVGVDNVPKYEIEANELAKKLGLQDKFTFICESALQLPYPDNSFDTIIMNDFMEHISDPEAAIEEALRLLTPDGLLYINFPPYGHPSGAHMTDVINIPWVHKFFSEKTLIQAYKELVADKPDADERLKLRIKVDPYGHEYNGYINKMTISKFKNILKEMDIYPQHYEEIPLRKILTPLAKIPFTKEAFVGMVVCVIEKPKPVYHSENNEYNY